MLTQNTIFYICIIITVNAILLLTTIHYARRLYRKTHNSDALVDVDDFSAVNLWDYFDNAELINFPYTKTTTSLHGVGSIGDSVGVEYEEGLYLSLTDSGVELTAVEKDTESGDYYVVAKRYLDLSETIVVTEVIADVDRSIVLEGVGNQPTVFIGLDGDGHRVIALHQHDRVWSAITCLAEPGYIGDTIVFNRYDTGYCNDETVFSHSGAAILSSMMHAAVSGYVGIIE